MPMVSDIDIDIDIDIGILLDGVLGSEFNFFVTAVFL
jgi:hypothetical protein